MRVFDRAVRLCRRLPAWLAMVAVLAFEYPAAAERARVQNILDDLPRLLEATQLCRQVEQLDHAYACQEGDCWPDVWRADWRWRDGEDQHFAGFLRFCRRGTPLTQVNGQRLFWWRHRIARATAIQSAWSDQWRSWRPSRVCQQLDEHGARILAAAGDALERRPRGKLTKSQVEEYLTIADKPGMASALTALGYIANAADPVDEVAFADDVKDRRKRAKVEALLRAGDKLNREILCASSGQIVQGTAFDSELESARQGDSIAGLEARTRGILAGGATAALGVAVQGLAQFVEHRAQQELEFFVADKLQDKLCPSGDGSRKQKKKQKKNQKENQAKGENRSGTDKLSFWIPHTCSLLGSDIAGHGALRWHTLRESLEADLRTFPHQLERALALWQRAKPLRVALRLAQSVYQDPSPERVAASMARIGTDLGVPALASASALLQALMSLRDIDSIPRTAQLGLVNTLALSALPLVPPRLLEVDANDLTWNDWEQKWRPRLVTFLDGIAAVCTRATSPCAAHVVALRTSITQATDIQSLKLDTIKKRLTALWTARFEERVGLEMANALRTDLNELGRRLRDLPECRTERVGDCLSSLLDSLQRVGHLIDTLEFIVGDKVRASVLAPMREWLDGLLPENLDDSVEALAGFQGSMKAILSAVANVQNADARLQKTRAELKKLVADLARPCAAGGAPDIKEQLECFRQLVGQISVWRDPNAEQWKAIGAELGLGARTELHRLFSDGFDKTITRVQQTARQVFAAAGVTVPALGSSPERLLTTVRSLARGAGEIRTLVRELREGELDDIQRKALQKLLLRKNLALVRDVVPVIPGLDDYRLPDEVPDLVDALVERDLDAALVLAMRMATDMEPTIGVPSSAIKALTFAAELVAAETSADVRKAIESYAAPVGSWREKRREGGARVYISGLVGAFTAWDKHRNVPLATLAEDSRRVGLHASVGLELNLAACRSWRICKSSTLGLYAPVIDLGGLVSVPFADTQGQGPTASRTDSALDLRSVLAPGLFVRVGLGNSPFVLAVGGQYVPRGASLEYTGTDGSPAAAVVDAWRWSAVLAIDTTIFAFK